MAPKRLLWRLLPLTAILLAVVLAFAGGVAVQTACPALGQRCFPSLKPKEAVSGRSQLPIPCGIQANREEEKDDQLLRRVGAHGRHLAEQKADLQRQDKELNIAYHILRARGQPSDSPECTRLVERHKQIIASLKELETALAEVERLESKLHALVDAHGTPAGDVALDVQLRTEIRRYLARAATTGNAASPIPDEQWHGGPDKFMRLNSAGYGEQDR